MNNHIGLLDKVEHFCKDIMKSFLSLLMFLSLSQFAYMQNDPVEALTKGLGAIRIEIADTATWVKIAKVNLHVGSLSFENGQLKGDYHLDVPLIKSKKESGDLVLNLDQSVADYAIQGGTLRGLGYAHNKDETRKITVSIKPIQDETKMGEMEFSVDTGKRIMEFSTTYKIVDAGNV